MIGSSAGRVAERRREGVWPRVYRLRRGQRLFLGGLGVLGIAAGVAGTGAILLGGSAAPPALALIPLAFALFGAYLLAAVRVGRIVLYEDAIELIELGKGRRRLRKDEITGVRLVAMQYGQAQLRFELRGGRKPVKAHWVHESDEVLHAWLAALPDLDAQERARDEAELLRSTALGRDEGERRRTLDRARNVARVVNGAAVAAAVWGWFLPGPYLAAVATLAAFPLVGLALLLAGRGRYAFDSHRAFMGPGSATDPRPALITSILFPGLVLGLRAILDLQVLDWKPLAAGAAAGAVALTAAIAVGEAKLRRSWLLPLLALLLGFYPWGALSLANALLDRAEPEEFEATVLRKHVSTGKHTSYELRLGPWGPVTEEGEVEVARGVYDRVATGDRVCVLLRPGALGARWFAVLRCPDHERPPAPAE